jgi:hypothetical protein
MEKNVSYFTIIETYIVTDRLSEIAWLDCGITGSGWVPPPVTLDNFVYVDLNTAMSTSNTPFQACSDFVQQFQDMSGQTGIPAVLLMSISLQESGCQQGATGPNGEIGLMQITPDKCPSSGDCYDPDVSLLKCYYKFRTDCLSSFRRTSELVQATSRAKSTLQEVISQKHSEGTMDGSSA